MLWESQSSEMRWMFCVVPWFSVLFCQLSEVKGKFFIRSAAFFIHVQLILIIFIKQKEVFHFLKKLTLHWIEPWTFALLARRSNPQGGKEWKSLALHGIEPWTSALLARRSNQLSYKANWRKLSCLSYLVTIAHQTAWFTQNSFIKCNRNLNECFFRVWQIAKEKVSNEREKFGKIRRNKPTAEIYAWASLARARCM